MQDFAKYTGIAFQMIATILVCTYLGYLLDRWLGLSFPVGILLGVFFGVGSSLYVILKKF
ncbi:MAG: AtpZ/AtpI family protein [Bacteroidetes bacterium]|jgi:F0F1-type ATP synthase assembly protein I|nr:AtpZ/AtpI family protein [Bacteroidota bacterium]